MTIQQQLQVNRTILLDTIGNLLLLPPVVAILAALKRNYSPILRNAPMSLFSRLFFALSNRAIDATIDRGISAAQTTATGCQR